MTKVGIIGCGLIGQKRAEFLGPAKLILCADPLLERAESLAASFPHCQPSQNWQEVAAHPEVDLVIIATPHFNLAELSIACLQAGKHILVEKPAARNVTELTEVLKIAHEKQRLAHVGFNHRYHRAFRQARTIVDEGLLGELMFIRARYGHGGRVGYEKEWRAKPELSGGGELIDQGVHLIDLARWFLGDFTTIQGSAHTFFWNMPVDDNAFLLLKTRSQQVAHLHVSCTEWKNLFSFEIYGKKGKLDIQGLGGSYGVERLSWYKMSAAMGPPETFIWEYPMQDDSWHVEFNEFLEDIRLNRKPSASLEDALRVLAVVEQIYQLTYKDKEENER